MKCRHCLAPIDRPIIDLCHQPPSNAYLTADEIEQPEVRGPLRAYVCERCWLVQIPAVYQARQLFTPSYAYFSSVSKSWVEHARLYTAEMIDRFDLDAHSFVVEIASNDGYLLQFFKDAGIPCLGIEPTASTAAAARKRGIETAEEFFGEAVGRRLAAAHGQADLMAANNVLAHVPEINDFVAGFRELLGPEGVATFEFPHLLRLINEAQFDTIYHEHFSYLSLRTVQTICETQGLNVFDVEELPSHGGSLRVFVARSQARSRTQTARLTELLAREDTAGMFTRDFYESLRDRAFAIKLDLLSFLIEQKRKGRRVACYGAAAKGNTLFNYAGVSSDLVDFVCDAATSKQGLHLPGSHIPILPPSALRERRPDFVLILPWNLKDEIVAAHGYIRDWGASFVVAVPELRIL